MSINPLLVNLTINEIMNKAIKYEEIKQKHKQQTMKYEKRKREEKDINFLEKKKQYSKNYYEKNKEKVIKKQLEKYHNKKKPVLSEEVN
jgi:hypothetical protein